MCGDEIILTLKIKVLALKIQLRSSCGFLKVNPTQYNIIKVKLTKQIKVKAMFCHLCFQSLAKVRSFYISCYKPAQT